MELFLFSFGLCLQLALCHSTQVCLSTWTLYPRSYSLGGLNVASAVQLEDCLARCERQSNCLAVDFNFNSQIPCWLHDNPDDLVGHSFYVNTQDNKTQYRINRNCSDYGPGPDCPVQWTRDTSVGSYYGEQVNYWTEYECFTYCVYTDPCVAVDFNNKTSPPCWIHKDDNLSSTAIQSDGVVQYRLNKTGPPPTNSSSFQIGRCVGQYFPTTDWCPYGSRIHINNSWFKANALCCYRNAEDVYPPDSSSLTRVGMSYADSNYFNEINSSCDGRPSCNNSIRAKGYSIIETDQICSDSQVWGATYVSISYDCIPDGSLTTEATTTRTTRGTPAKPTATTTTTTTTTTIATTTTTPAATAKTTSHDDVKAAASVEVAKKENSNSLIIGLVIGLGVPLILIIIIVIVVLVRRRKRKDSYEAKENHLNDKFYYTSETAPRGVVPENEQNEISMAVDSLY